MLFPWIQSLFTHALDAKTIVQNLNTTVTIKEILRKHIKIVAAPDHTGSDLAIPFFFASNYFEQKPPQLVEALLQSANELYKLEKNNGKVSEHYLDIDKCNAERHYLNIVLNRKIFMQEILTIPIADFLSVSDSSTEASDFDEPTKGEPIRGQRIMIEFSAPNTNKPLHLGHLRNDVLGESISRILEEAGATVRKVNLVNDRGVHICKSQAAYRKFGNEKSPEDEGIKPDAFVGNYYVKYDKWAKDDPEALKIASQLLRDWEQGDEDVRAQQKKLNDWALSGILQTYKRTDIHFDTIYFESNTYLLGKRVVEQGLRDKVFFKSDDGSVRFALSGENSESKVLLREDGTSVYITQDLGTVFKRYEDWNFDQKIYVVAHEQNYHFRVLFSVLSAVGFEPAIKASLVHLGYGMVHLPDGRMKSREGTVLDADALIDTVASNVQKQILLRGRDKELDDLAKVAEKVAVGAIHYYLLQIHPKKDIVFDINKSIAFEGNTGPYLQYTCARLISLLERYEKQYSDDLQTFNTNYESIETVSDAEWAIALLLDEYTETVYKAAEKKEPSLLAQYLYQLATACASWYQSFSLLKERDANRRYYIVALIRRVLATLQRGMRLLVIPFLERM